MLWSLTKVILFVALIAALALGAGYLLEADGGIRVSAGTVELNLRPFQTAAALVLLILAIWLLLKLGSLAVATVRFLNGDETAISRWFDRNRERKGYQALADGLVALASGDGREAMGQAARAKRFLRKPELTDLIAAQAAELAGDKSKAETVYKRLLGHDSTRFVGVRGIMKQRLADGDMETATKLAEKAFALKPRHEETQDILLKLQAKHSDWKGARRTLGAKLSTGTLPRDVFRRRDAVLALSESKAFLSDGSSAEAETYAIEANRLSPDLIPAAVLAARRHIEHRRKRHATRVLKKAWQAQPHPDLAAVFAEIEADETPEQRIKRFGPLIKMRPDDPETKMLLAELHIAAEDFPAARRALGDLMEETPTARALTIMAAVERGEGAEDKVVRGWLARAVTASRGPQWVCGNCRNVHAAWIPVCKSCGAFDTLAWTVPEEGEVAMPESTGMLPLIVGLPEAEPESVDLSDENSHEEADGETVDPLTADREASP